MELDYLDDVEDAEALERAAIYVPETQYDLDPEYRGLHTASMKATLRAPSDDYAEWS